MPHGPNDDPRWPSAFPEPIAGLVEQARQQRWPIDIQFLYDAERKYLGYRCTITVAGTTPRDFDIIGPISFCVPADALRPEQRTELAGLRDVYAPPATGGPDQCYRYEAEQAMRYRRWKDEQERKASPPRP